MAVDIPNYRVIEKLGVGAQSRIYRARCMRTGGDYSVKIVKIIKPEDAGVVDLLRTEHAIGTAIDHPAVRKVFEFRLLRQRLRVRGAILFMEYVDGRSMSDKEFPRELDGILRYAIAAAEGLHAMHTGGFVHADLKPNNIMVTANDGVKLIDLGQSARIREAKSRVQGTIDYMAPEQVQRGSLDQRTDVFGLGATLHKVLTGKAIATEMNQTVNLHSQSLVGRRVTEMRQETMQDLPACIRRLLDDCCQQHAADRIPDMLAFIERTKMARTVLARQAANGPQTDDLDDDRDEDDESDEVVADRAPDDARTVDPRP
jgi:serine/threonine-protein kinase